MSYWPALGECEVHPCSLQKWGSERKLGFDVNKDAANNNQPDLALTSGDENSLTQTQRQRKGNKKNPAAGGRGRSEVAVVPEARHQIHLVTPPGSCNASPTTFLLVSVLCRDLTSPSVWRRDLEEPPAVPSDDPRLAVRGQDDQRAVVVQDLHAGSQSCARCLLRQDLLRGGQPVAAGQPLLVAGAARHADEETDVPGAAEQEQLGGVLGNGAQPARLQGGAGHHPQQAWVYRTPRKYPQQARVERKLGSARSSAQSERSREHAAPEAGLQRPP